MNQIAELARLIENLIRIGTVAEVQIMPPRVRVKTGKIITAWLPWFALRAGNAKEWDPPTVGEQVVLFSPSGQLGQGMALTGLYSDANPANGDRAGLHRRTYADGAVVEYDSVAHHLNATLPAGGTTNLVSDGGIRIIGPITHEGDYTHTGNYRQTGDQAVTGTVMVTEDVVAAEVSLVKHPHGGVMPGTAKTGLPEPSA
ncbi:phage baseplate assembly protein V [Pseudomonas entomophila]|uniref:phage baseplate assembly protein V n=1 Tax=Pseudomonas entomophila TaxID=312306 RepID=UPI0023D8B795|nr:phage baseplate assembly protein V [Pseudomonas entomophila]MDF0732323.1 phage baseplate assembly protein V [Pseudomonas entomophila]